MKKLFLSLTLLVAASLAPLFAATGGPENILPTPARITAADGTVAYGKPQISIGGQAFRKATASLPAFAQEEAYRLTISRKGIRIEANTATGAFYAQKSLDQMRRGGDTLACCTVFDYPRFAYRGVMLDISRHFRDKAFILKQIDAMAEVRLNRLHLHLTDDAGWRI